MSERNEKRSGLGGAIAGIVLILLFAPVLYVLSIGPVAMLVNHNDPLQWMVVPYYPLACLAEYRPIGDALKWYVELWSG